MSNLLFTLFLVLDLKKLFRSLSFGFILKSICLKSTYTIRKLGEFLIGGWPMFLLIISSLKFYFSLARRMEDGSSPLNGNLGVDNLCTKKCASLTCSTVSSGFSFFTWPTEYMYIVICRWKNRYWMNGTCFACCFGFIGNDIIYQRRRSTKAAQPSLRNHI